MILIPKVSRIMGWNGTMGRDITKSPYTVQKQMQRHKMQTFDVD